MSRTNPSFLILLIGFLFFGSQVYSQSTRKELEQHRKEIQQEINTISSLLSEAESEEKSMLGRLNDINIQIDAQEELIDAFNSEAAALNSEINLFK